MRADADSFISRCAAGGREANGSREAYHRRPAGISLPLSLSLLTAMMIAPLGAEAAEVENTQDLPFYLRDRGTGVATSQFGTYVRDGELLVYPFFEWYSDSDLEYKPSELGYGLDEDHRGHYRASEGLLFFGYGITRNLALELEGAVISASLEKSPSDPSAMPPKVEESGLGDVEG